MSATEAPSEAGFSDTAAVALFDATADDEVSSELSEPEDGLQNGLPNGTSKSKDNGEGVVKLEKDADGAVLIDHTTPTSLRPAPSPSRKRRESEVNGTVPEFTERPNNKKRKRGTSPPWQFPTAETTTLKTADGRRASARVSINTPPVHSDSEHPRARSSSLASTFINGVRQQSPPWKKFEAEGPTSLVVDGKRKSGRVNKELTDPPKRVSPRSKKLEDKGKQSHVSPSKSTAASKALHNAVNGTGQSKAPAPPNKQSAMRPPTHRPSSSSDNATKIAELRAQIKALNPDRSSQSPKKRRPTSSHKRKHSDDRKYAQLDGSNSPESLRKPTPNKHSFSPETRLKPSPKIKLRFSASRHVVPPQHPHAQMPSPTRPPALSVWQAIEDYELKEMQQPYTENERGPPDLSWFLQRAEKQAAEEGAIRRKILREAEQGGVLSRERLGIYQDTEQQREPPKQYGHHDHLVSHALYLRHLQLREKGHHRLLAKKLAQEAVEAWKARRGPTEEDIQLEQEKLWKLIYKQVVVDMKAKWDMVFAHVHRQRIQAWEAEEEIRRQERLREKLEWSENLTARIRGEDEVSESEEEDDGSDDAEGDADQSGSGSDTEEENMSESGSEGEEKVEEDAGLVEGEMGEEELRAYLEQRKAEATSESQIADEDEHEDDSADISMADMDNSEVQNDNEAEIQNVSMADLLTEQANAADDDEDEPDDEFDPDAENAENEDEEQPEEATTAEQAIRRSRRSSTAPGQDVGDNEEDFSSDRSTNMDSTDYDSDEDMSSTDEEDNGHESGQTNGAPPPNPMLSLFGDLVEAANKTVERPTGLPTPTTSAEGDAGERQAEAGAVSAEVEDDDQDQADQNRPEDVEEEIVSPVAGRTGDSVHEEFLSTKHLVPSPALLRGTLRSYQQSGLDWLASLYRNGTNGILADEMGLGKTIQTIALLAHLAEEHACWESHLIIVPTSVVLNWVTEFQKFLPGFRVMGYYGSSEERQVKRKGWVNDPHHEQKEKRGYNVIITSYNVAMQDINAIRNVQWHYLVLDEAHNIRNFNSQRWQVLIRLKTRARLLLTGTPLQNSLTELWSLLTFLTAGDDDPQQGDLEEFLSHWKEPVKEIFDRGVQTLSTEAQKVVDQLHISLRPFLLRRLKSEVEKDLPKKTEQVVVCKLSKRQRQLYQDYMGLAETKRSLTQGNAVTAGKVLLSLRRVCNHPDLFDPRGIETGFGMETPAVDGFAVKENVVRRLLGIKEDVSFAMLVKLEARRGYAVKRARQLDSTSRFLKEIKDLEGSSAADPEPDPATLSGCQALQRLRLHQRKLKHVRSCMRSTFYSLDAVPVYGSDLRELLTIQRGQAYRVAAKDIRGRVVARQLRGWPSLGRYPLKSDADHVSDWLLSKTSMLQQSVQTVETYGEAMHDALVRFAFVPPKVTAPILPCAIPSRTQQFIRACDAYPIGSDFAHEARIRTSIVFPDSRLLIYDAGKLQRLTVLLRELQSRGSRSLIFTQMTGTLNILEQFLNLLNLPYLRLDGSTPVERRQLYSAEFNRPDSKYQCMILSSRAGGVGLNLVGASSVIFYDLDWNPQMDRQCMDRAHRIGQVRDVEVYKMVSEKTVEENILLRANQKSLLDQTVIQEGHFTTDFSRDRQDKTASKDEDGEGEEDVAAAIERFLGSGNGNEKSTNQALESVEDKEDVQAAQQARKEEHQDDADFADRSSKGASGPPTPGHLHAEDGGEAVQEEHRMAHLDFYLIRHMEWLMKDVRFVPPAKPSARLDKHGRDRSHRKRKR